MRRASAFRRFLLPLAGVVCWAGLSLGTEQLRPPQPPADNDGLELDERAYFSPTPVKIEPLTPASNPEPLRIAKREELAETPNFDSRSIEPIALQPADLPPEDPQPLVEQPLIIYPEVLPQAIYAPSCQTVMPSCSTGLYGESPVCEGDCGCGETMCAGCCLPSWTVRAEVLIWDRAGGTNVPLVNAPVLLNSGDLDGSWRVGPRLTAIKHGVLGSCWDLEVAYFGISDWSGTAVLADADAYLTNPPIVIAGVVPLTATYSSSLHSGEINARRMWSDWVTWFVGFRTLQIDESLVATFAASSHSVETRNSLYGAQLGLDAILYEGDCWTFNAVGKVGIYGNSADQVTRTVGVGGALPFITYTGGQTSFVGELGINARYHMTERLSLLAGYNLLWVNGLALAPEQLAATDISTGVGALDANGNLFYHGVNLGFEYGW